jgi:large subunit GTPase 1
MSADELALKEGEAFLEWRRGLAKIEEDAGMVMTPYEKNLDFWRQLWRTVDRSDLLVQILDARDPDFYLTEDLEKYVRKFENKRHLILLNKADFLSKELRRSWRKHLQAQGCDVVLFSALRELHHQQRLPGGRQDPSASSTAAPREEDALAPHGCLLRDDPEVADCDQLMEELKRRLPKPESEGGAGGVIGFVGYPNVGKSSVINALFGAKKVSMSRTPGKTKHLQTLELTGGLTLCDCPGLVFPSVVATKAHLAINGTAPLDELRDFVAPARLVVQKVGAQAILDRYSVGADSVKDGTKRLAIGEKEDSTRSVLAALATARQHFLRLGVPDETWAARRVLKDYCTGALLHCEPPPGFVSSAEKGKGNDASAAATAPTPAVEPAEPAGAEDDAEDDFSDLDGFLRGELTGTHAGPRDHRRKQKGGRGSV